MARGLDLAIEHWEAHLYHIICGVWADRRCRVCAMKSAVHRRAEQWNQKPKLQLHPLAGEVTK